MQNQPQSRHAEEVKLGAEVPKKATAPAKSNTMKGKKRKHTKGSRKISFPMKGHSKCPTLWDSIYNFSSGVSNVFSWPPWVPDTHVVHRHVCV